MTLTARLFLPIGPQYLLYDKRPKRPKTFFKISVAFERIGPDAGGAYPGAFAYQSLRVSRKGNFFFAKCATSSPTMVD